MDCQPPAYYHSLGTDEKYEYVAPFLCTLVIPNWHHANASLSTPPVLFPQEVISVYGAAVAFNENGLVTDLSRA